jgi:hypothetical protein
MPLHPTYWRPLLILSSYQHLGIPSGLLPPGLPTKSLYAPPPHTCNMLRPSHSSWFPQPYNIWWSVLIIKLLVMKSSPLPCHLVPLTPKFLPQHPILDTPSTSVSPSLWETKFHTHTTECNYWTIKVFYLPILNSTPHTHTNTDLIKYAATLSNQPQRRILTDYFNNYNFSKLK